MACLDPAATFFTFQTFDDNPERDDPKLARILHGTLEARCSELVSLNNKGAGIFVTINATDGKGRTTENIVVVRGVFADLDGAPLEPVLRNGRLPHIVVNSSPNRWHTYWRVAGMKLDDFGEVQKELARCFNGDPSVCDLPRVMRLPGFLHRKREPFLVRIAQTNDAPPYPAANFQKRPNDAAADIEHICQNLREAKAGKNRNIELNKAAFLVGQLISAGLIDEATARERLTQVASDIGLGDKEIRKTLDSGIAAGKKHTGTILDPNNPMQSAHELVGVMFIKDAHRTMHRHRGAYWLWSGTHYRLVDDETVRAKVWDFLEGARRLTNKGIPAPFKPKRDSVGNVQDALMAVCQLDNQIEPPTWFDPDMPPASEFLACGNGLLHLPSGELYQHTPEFFALGASEVHFNPDAPPPTRWLNFLSQVFEDDLEAIETLQDWFGYSLTPDTSQQKILLMVGPKRSGKGTMARVMTAVLGRESVVGPTMGSLGDAFGLEPLISKFLAIIADARIGAYTDKSTVVERLLAISGEDQMSVGRKFKSAWHGHLRTRFLIMTNELPAFTDGSGALAGRFIILLLVKSFYGKEDPALTDKLLTEAPGILNWAIEGYRRLRSRGHFNQPESSREAMEEIELLAAPVKAFVRDCCIVGPGLSITVDALWAAYQEWTVEQGQTKPGTKNWFGRNLKSAEPGVKIKKPREGEGARERTYIGIALKEGWEPKPSVTINLQQK